MARGGAWAAVLLTIAAATVSALDAPHGLAEHTDEGRTISSGQVFFDAEGDLEWTAQSPGSVRVIVDGNAAISPVALEPGRHLIEISYPAQSNPVLRRRAGDAHVSEPMSSSAFAPYTLSAWRWQLRALRVWVGLSAAATWMLALTLLMWTGLTKRLPGPAMEFDRPLRLLLAGSAIAMVIGIRWGWPVLPWAPDELWPSQVLAGLSKRFSGGWFDLYPPGHFYLLSLLYAPVLLLQAAGWLPIDSAARDAVLHLAGRFVSTGMALAVIVLVARLATQLGGRRYAWPSALCAAVSLPFVFYARVGNLDVPYLFWFCLSLLWFHACVNEPRARTVAWFAATGMMAVLTKDQAYGLYVIPALWLFWGFMRRPGGAVLISAGAIAAIAVVVFGHNLLFNAAGFREHVASITGGGSEGYRMAPRGFAGLAILGRIISWQLWWVLGLPGVVLILAGLWFHRRDRWIPRWLWLFPLSYLLLFVAVVGYSYDRFMLPIAIVLGLLGGTGLRGLLAAQSRSTFAPATAVICVAWMVWRVASVDALQAFDTRYDAERWLRGHVPRGAFVATVWQGGYLPRLDGFQYGEIEPTRTATEKLAPEFVVVNVDFMSRYDQRSPVRQWWQWLESDGSPFEEVYRARRQLRWSELAWWPMFQDGIESNVSNLDKASPEIVVYARRGLPAVPE